jgi:RNA polymerase sigma factor (sigma-70 family)
MTGPEPASLTHLLGAAAAGDQDAWEAIVDRFTGLVWATARAHRLDSADAADVAQTTWLRLVEHLDRIREPETLGAWLATTARRECLRLIRLRSRERAEDDLEALLDPVDETPDAGLFARERDAELWKAFRGLGERCRRLLRLVCSPFEPSYVEIGAALGMPIGAIGPTRARCLEQLRRRLPASQVETWDGIR